MVLQNLFSAVMEMTITGSAAIGCVLLARLALKRAPRVFSYGLWMVVLFRLLCPVALPSPVSVMGVVEMPAVEPRVSVVEYVTAPADGTAVTVESGGAVPAAGAPAVSSIAEPSVDWQRVAVWVWAAGVLALAAYGIMSYVNLKRKLRETVPAEPGVRELDTNTTPFVLGLFRPVIYLPAGLDSREREYILCHEWFHVRHLDPQVRAVFFAAVCLHWFNPLVWLAFFLFCRDMEMRCDEAVLRHFGGGVRCDYAQSLLNFATRHYALAAPLAFGEGDTGKRVRNVLNWKKTSRWMVLLAAAVCAAVFLMTGCDPAQELESPFGHSYRVRAVTGMAEAELDQVTLTSDTMLVVRQDSEDQIYGAMKAVKPGTPLPDTMPTGMPPEGKPENTWKTGDGGWWLMQMEDGTLWLWKEGEYLVSLQRVDLLTVTVRQPGAESHIEPAWFSGEVPDWFAGTLSSTGVDGAAELAFDFEAEVDSIMVSEQYFERLADGEFSIVTTDTVLNKDEGDGFRLEVSRRGGVGDDHAIYTVQAEGQCYQFRLHFPVIPGETSYTHAEQTKRTVEFSENGAYIRLQLPGDWECALTSFAENETMAGIRFWPRGYSDAALEFSCYDPYFGICGTDLEETEMILGGRSVWVGTYGLYPIWSFISLDKRFAVVGYGHEAWWDEYGDVAMEILDSAEFGFVE